MSVCHHSQTMSANNILQYFVFVCTCVYSLFIICCFCLQSDGTADLWENSVVSQQSGCTMFFFFFYVLYYRNFFWFTLKSIALSAREHCRTSSPRLLAECHERRLNQGSFVLLCFALFTFPGLCLVCAYLCIFNLSTVVCIPSRTNVDGTVKCW